MNQGETRGGLQCVCHDLQESLESLREIQRLQPVTPQEGRYRDLDTDPDFPTEVRAVLGCLFTDCLEPAIRSLQDLASYEPGNRTERPGEVTREALYDLVVRDNFTARPTRGPISRRSGRRPTRRRRQGSRSSVSTGAGSPPGSSWRSRRTPPRPSGASCCASTWTACWSTSCTRKSEPARGSGNRRRGRLT